MLKESFIVQKRLEMRDRDIEELFSWMHNMKVTLDLCHELQLEDTAKDVVQMINLVEDEMSDRRKSGEAFDHFFGKQS